MAHVDNEGAVVVLSSGYSKEGQIMHLMNSLFFIVANYQISLKACHIPGSQNGAADAISRDNISCTVHLVAPGGGPDPNLRSGAAGVTPGDGEIRLNVDSLVPVVQELFSAGVAASSMKVYKTSQNRYAHFCERYSILPYPTLRISFLSLSLSYLLRV